MPYITGFPVLLLRATGSNESGGGVAEADQGGAARIGLELDRIVFQRSTVRMKTFYSRTLWLLRQPILSPSRRYALLYFALIPLFGLLYAAYPHDFYFATVAQEPQAKEAWESYLKVVETAVRSPRHATAFDLSGKSVNVDLSDFTIDRGSGEVGNPHSLSASLRFQTNDQLRIYRIPVDVESSGSFIRLSVGPIQRISGGSVEFVESWSLPENGVQDLKRVDGYRLGFPNDPFWPTFWRMCYFSSITIFTIGYGDIVPLTHWARAWVVVEAFAGLAVAGLFLNALTQKRTKAPAIGSAPDLT